MSTYFLISYDAPAAQDAAILRALTDATWEVSTVDNGVSRSLPRTTLWKAFPDGTTLGVAQAAATAALASASTRAQPLAFTRSVVIPFSVWSVK